MRRLPLGKSLRREAEEEIGLGMSELTRVRTFHMRPFVTLNLTPLDPKEHLLRRPDVLYLSGTVSLCRCRSIKAPNASKPFLLIFEKAGFLSKVKSCRFDSYEDMVRQAEGDPYLTLLLKVTNVSQFQFDLAERNYGVKIPIGYDFRKYVEAVGDDRLFERDYDRKSFEKEEAAIAIFNKRYRLITKKALRGEGT